MGCESRRSARQDRDGPRRQGQPDRGQGGVHHGRVRDGSAAGQAIRLLAATIRPSTTRSAAATSGLPFHPDQELGSRPSRTMCGLYASIAFAPERARIDRVAHRGPDGSGWREFASAAGPVALGHRRLAIIDLSEAGLQPMADASGRYHLVFNGEIYNYLELRDELRAKGHPFSSETDSEVLLAAYREWGEGCLRSLPRHVRVPDLGRARPASCSRRAIASASSRSTWR